MTPDILLARLPGGPPGMFGLIAGFVEHGENLEHALVREVKEETGISVKNIRHGASEPWPFPDSLMMGFTADFTGGELVVDWSELESAFWFDRKHLPRIPEKISISRALIDRWFDQGRSQDSRDTLMELSAGLSVPARPGTINTPLRFWFFLFSCYERRVIMSRSTRSALIEYMRSYIQVYNTVQSQPCERLR